MDGETPSNPDSGSSTRVAKPKRILIVEDEQIVVLALQAFLEGLGYLVVGTADSSNDALELASREDPDLILMDIQIKGHMDGLQTAAAIREILDIPIVYLTANADSQTISRAMETEPEGYVAKPYNHLTLQTTIELAIRKHEAKLSLCREYEGERKKYDQTVEQLGARAEKLRSEWNRDSLTALHNRRHFDDSIVGQLNLAKLNAGSLGLILFDVDHFKHINDTHGHSAGDNVLKSISDLLRSELREREILCRYGGDEIAILAPCLSFNQTVELAERLRREIEKLSLKHQAVSLNVTVSCGVAVYPDDASNASELFQAADTALYRAKAEGRNRVIPRRRGCG